jgi:hypothetical protein
MCRAKKVPAMPMTINPDTTKKGPIIFARDQSDERKIDNAITNRLVANNRHG